MVDNLTGLMIRDFFWKTYKSCPVKKNHAHFEEVLHLRIEWFINRFALHILTNPSSEN